MPAKKPDNDTKPRFDTNFKHLVELYSPRESVGHFFQGIALKAIEQGFLTKEWLYSFGLDLSFHDYEIDLLFEQFVKKDYVQLHEKGFVLLVSFKEFFENQDRRICSHCHVIFAPKMKKFDLTSFHDSFFKAQHSLGVCSRQCRLFLEQSMKKPNRPQIFKQVKIVVWGETS